MSDPKPPAPARPSLAAVPAEELKAVLARILKKPAKKGGPAKRRTRRK